jgi:hypothetical protein
MKEAREWEAEIDGVQPQSLSAAAADPALRRHRTTCRCLQWIAPWVQLGWRTVLGTGLPLSQHGEEI